MILPLVIYNYSIPSFDESRWAYVPSQAGQISRPSMDLNLLSSQNI